MEAPVLLVDKRQASWQEAHLRERGFDVRMCMLPSGDFAWSTPYGRVGVEDKPLGALVTDRRNGRLDDELRRLVDAYTLPILFIRGMPTIGSDGSLRWLPQEREYREGWTIDSLDNLLLGRQLRGVFVTWCPTDEYLSERLWHLYEYTQRKPKDEVFMKRAPIMPYLGPLTGRAELIYTILAQVKGIRDKREISERLAAKYDLGKLLYLDQKGWQNEGFTKLMAGKLVAHIRAVVWENA